VEEVFEMTSKAQKIDYTQLLLRRYTRVEEIMEKARATNRSRDLPEKFMRYYINISKLTVVKCALKLPRNLCKN
jgi:hypothetical protein